MSRIHLDTDFGGDPDDACALAMLLGWEGVELLGVTTNLDGEGMRAGAVGRLLELTDRTEVPVVAGGRVSMTSGARYEPATGDPRYWPEPPEARPADPRTALDLLQGNIEVGATIATIGALTNLAELERARPGVLGGARVVAMAGWVEPPAAGLPQWVPEMDFNVQCDTRAAEIVFGAAGELTLVTLPATLRAQLRQRDLPRLVASGPVGALLAGQSAARGEDAGFAELAREHSGVADDLVNFHYDPVTCAVAAGWEGATIEERRLSTELGSDGVLRFVEDAAGRVVSLVTAVDGAAFGEQWLACVERVGAAAR
jgi:purine nucleosidase